MYYFIGLIIIAVIVYLIFFRNKNESENEKKETMISMTFDDKINDIFLKYTGKYPSKTNLMKIKHNIKSGLITINQLERNVLRDEINYLLKKYTGRKTIPLSEVEMWVGRFINIETNLPKMKQTLIRASIENIASKQNINLSDKDKNNLLYLFKTGKIYSYTDLVRQIQECGKSPSTRLWGTKESFSDLNPPQIISPYYHMLMN